MSVSFATAPSITATITYNETVLLPPLPPEIHSPIPILHGKRHCMELAADKCAAIPVLGILAAIPRILCASTMLLGNCMITCIPCVSEMPCHCTVSRAHNECIRGFLECLPFGSQCISCSFNYEGSGLLSPLGYGSHIYTDVEKGYVVYSEKGDHLIYGWKQIEYDDEGPCCCCPEEYAVTNFKEPPAPVPRIQTNTSTRRLTPEEFQNFHSVIELSAPLTQRMAVENALPQEAPELSTSLSIPQKQEIYG